VILGKYATSPRKQSKHEFVDASIHHKCTVLVVPGTRIPPERTAACGANDAVSRECFLPTLLLSWLLSVMVFRTPRDAERALARLIRGPRDGSRRDVKQHARPDPPRERAHPFLGDDAPQDGDGV